eukprot:CAMPEP_0116823052 /NCGR_PEP_ID=MMETSP0418-20121206/622_1 /TAXON_ID=1158023 /ORGANISM="Astrosyne radiata, Strain 13vi08-1A" /LENGTH=425 /DNA_ID=CAMNT_0004451259 /DNA_START=2258 /DNA_END=3535 /DNA_ORIENTATION=+
MQILFGGLLWVIATVPLQAQSLLTLQNVVQHVLAQNIDIQIARNKQKISANNYHIGKAGFLPILDANFGVNKKYPTWPKPKTSEGAVLHTDVELRWTLFDGMRNVFTYQHLGKISQITQLETQQIIEEKVANAMKSYYRLALAQQAKHVLEEGLLVSEEALQLAKAKYEVGQCNQLDYLNAQVQHNEVQAKLSSQDEEQTMARLALHSLMGQEVPDDFKIVEDIPPPSKLTWEMLTKDLTTANTSMRVAKKCCEDAALAIKLQKANLWPNVYFSLGYNTGSKYHTQGWKATPRGFKHGISICFNLFNAFQHHKAIQEAGIQADSAQLGLRAQQLRLEVELKKHFLHYTQQLQLYKLAQQHVQVSQDAVEVALAQYRLGLIALLALDKARQAAQETKLKCLKAHHNTKVTEIILQRLSGTLLDTLS